MINRALEDLKVTNIDHCINVFSLLSEALFLKNWQSAMLMLDHLIPYCIDNSYTTFKSLKTKEINLQIYREFKHAKRVSFYAAKLAQALTCSPSDICDIERAAFVHDIGKFIIDRRILYKEDALTDFEWMFIQKHPQFGCELLSLSKRYCHLAPIVMQHHERWDGNGYPRQIKGNMILFPARILSIVDAYDAMTCNRSYQRRMSSEAAATEIKRCAGAQFDPKIVPVFTDTVLSNFNCSLFNFKTSERN